MFINDTTVCKREIVKYLVSYLQLYTTTPKHDKEGTVDVDIYFLNRKYTSSSTKKFNYIYSKYYCFYLIYSIVISNIFYVVGSAVRSPGSDDNTLTIALAVIFSLVGALLICGIFIIILWRYLTQQHNANYSTR